MLEIQAFCYQIFFCVCFPHQNIEVSNFETMHASRVRRFNVYHKFNLVLCANSLRNHLYLSWLDTMQRKSMWVDLISNMSHLTRKNRIRSSFVGPGQNLYVCKAEAIVMFLHRRFIASATRPSSVSLLDMLKK